MFGANCLSLEQKKRLVFKKTKGQGPVTIFCWLSASIAIAGENEIEVPLQVEAGVSLYLTRCQIMTVGLQWLL
jgi:hypothetical protein